MSIVNVVCYIITLLTLQQKMLYFYKLWLVSAVANNIVGLPIAVLAPETV